MSKTTAEQVDRFTRYTENAECHRCGSTLSKNKNYCTVCIREVRVMN